MGQLDWALADLCGIPRAPDIIVPPSRMRVCRLPTKLADPGLQSFKGLFIRRVLKLGGYFAIHKFIAWLVRLLNRMKVVLQEFEKRY